MANRLKVAKVLSIKQLHGQGWSQRRIARELRISRDAVARHLAKSVDSGEPATIEGDSNKATSEKAPPGRGNMKACQTRPLRRPKRPPGPERDCPQI